LIPHVQPRRSLDSRPASAVYDCNNSALIETKATVSQTRAVICDGQARNRNHMLELRRS
jgi:hypothetical protein